MELEEWSRALARELGVDTSVDVRALLDVAKVAAHSVDRPAAPLTTYLIGWAAAQAGGTPEAVAAGIARTVNLARRWEAGERPAGPA